MPSSPRGSLLPVAAAVIDAALILLFAAIGRDTHQRGETVLGVLDTAWPFLAGATAGWLIARAWRAPLGVWPAGVVIWISAVAGGMLLRLASGHTAAVAFIVVALITLAVFLLGYRLLWALVLRLRTARRS
ncbi:DUF3054 domain-containing protein [Arthrobacter celericrescens]|uniref:DUF3054 domain-containing protein n=1 Tax=Arthrobacter celericrescens TaxID=2320851 RepID=UPI000EA2C65C|nr:DUF3054 domain-containing protein [Arthrobacter celericrescens]